jgi:putative transposase
MRCCQGVAFAPDQGHWLDHIQPGMPTQNAYVEGFNKTDRTEVLDCYVFDSLGRIPPVEYPVKQFFKLYF